MLFRSEATGSDIFKIEPKEKYPADYYECIDLAKKELQSKARPELVEYLDNVEEYDLIYLGFPNWWGDVPMCVYTFLEDCDLSGKTIKPFCTHEGSGFGGILHKLESKYGLEFEDGLSIQGSSVSGAKSKVENWL